MRNLTDFEIIESVRKGNQSDFALLIDRYKNRAFTLLKKILKNDMDAEEVLQDSFLKCYNALPSFRMESKFSTWFYRIVYNNAMTRVSGKKRIIESRMSSVDDHLDLESSYNSQEAEKVNFSEFVAGLVNNLPPNYAAVINMFYINDMTCEEIGEVMNISESNVKVLLHRSRNALRDIIEKKNLKEEFYD